MGGRGSSARGVNSSAQFGTKAYNDNKYNEALSGGTELTNSQVRSQLLGSGMLDADVSDTFGTADFGPGGGISYKVDNPASSSSAPRITVTDNLFNDKIGTYSIHASKTSGGKYKIAYVNEDGIGIDSKYVSTSGKTRG